MPIDRNLLFILADQLRPDFLGCYGARFIETPNIDRLAARGVLFQRAYSEHPICVPARASLLTGIHATKLGVTDNGLAIRPDYERCGVHTWPELLAGRGYYTSAIGKMHFYPWDARFGFQHRVIAEDKRWIYIRDDYYHYLHARGLRKYHLKEHEGYQENKAAVINLLPWEHQWDHFVGEQTRQFLREYGREGPFALMVGFPGPHCPYDPAPEFLRGIDENAMPEPVPDPGDAPGIHAKMVAGNLGAWNGVDYSTFSPAQKRKVRAHYAALVKQIDYEIGGIVATLEAQGLLDSTTIVFTSDHGDYLGDRNLIGKGHFFESSFHVPMIACGPGIAVGQTSTELVALTDVTATLLAHGGCEVPAHMDARPLPSVGIAGASGRDHLFGALHDGWLWYEGPWRYSKYASGEVFLYNVEQDPLEQQNRVDDPACRAIAHEYDAKLTAAVMASTLESYHERRVYVRDLSQTPEFGYEGWQRPYPRRVDER